VTRTFNGPLTGSGSVAIVSMIDDCPGIDSDPFHAVLVLNLDEQFIGSGFVLDGAAVLGFHPFVITPADDSATLVLSNLFSAGVVLSFDEPFRRSGFVFETFVSIPAHSVVLLPRLLMGHFLVQVLFLMILP
jgi:hypothetical protein